MILQAIFVAFICVLVLLKIIAVCTKGRCPSKVCLVGKTALITGGNSGIGLQTALELAARGCRLILADKADMKETKARIIRETKNSLIKTKFLDLECNDSIRQFAKELCEEEDKLDILINNAGIVLMQETFIKSGVERLMQVNFFGHFLLTHLLIDLLKKSAPSRIIFTSSIAAYASWITSLKHPSATKVFGYYNQSKLMMLIASNEFGRRLQKAGVTSNAYHPGNVVNTQIYKTMYKTEKNLLAKVLMFVYSLYTKTMDEGVQTTLYLACGNEFETYSGGFFMDCVDCWQPLQAYHTKMCDQLWKESEEIVDLKEHEKLKAFT